MSSLTFLVTELQSLASETRRKHPEIREAAEKSLALLRASPEQATQNLAIEGPQTDDLLRPVFMGCATKNAKVVAISIGSLQRLIALKAIPQSAVPVIITTMSDAMSQGVDIQLRILQTLLSLITNFPQVHGELLGDALLLCFKLQESRIAVVSSTAAATLRQLVMFVVDKVVDEERTGPPEATEEVTLPDGSTKKLTASSCDAYAVFEDLCLLANAERPNFLKLEFLRKTFALELIESVLTNYHDLFRKRTEIILLLQHHLCPLLLKALSDRPVFPLTLRCTRVAFLLLKQFSYELETEAEVFFMLLIRIVSEEGEGAADTSGVARPPWLRVLAMEIMRGLCNDAELIRNIYSRYDANGSSSSPVIGSLVTALKRLVTEKPAILGANPRIHGVGATVAETPSSATSEGFSGMAGKVAQAASATVHGVVGMMASSSGLSVETAMMKLQCIDQLDKAEAPPIPESYVYLLGVQCLVSLCEGFLSTVYPLYTTLVVHQNQRVAPPAFSLSSLPPSDPSTITLKTTQSMIESIWPALLAALSFVVATNLSDDLFVSVLGSYQAMTNVSGMLALSTPRDAFFTSLEKLAVPARVVSALNFFTSSTSDSLQTPRLNENFGFSTESQVPGLSDRNMACLKVLVASATFLAGGLGKSWYAVMEALQNADYVLTFKGTVTGTMSPVGKRGSIMGSRVSSTSISQPEKGGGGATGHPLLSDLDSEALLASIQRLFDASKNLEDAAFRDFVEALCKLSAEMVGMQSQAGRSDLVPVNEDDDQDGPSASSSSATLALTMPKAESGASMMRRASGLYIPRTLKSGDFGIKKLGGVSLLNVHRLVYRSPDVAWNTITGHLLSTLRTANAPAGIRTQAAKVLDDILIIAPRNISSTGAEMQSQVQQRVLDVLSGQIILDTIGGPSTSTFELRKMGLETLQQILQSSAHTLHVGWDVIFNMLSSVVKPVLPTIPFSPSVDSIASPSAPPSPIKSRHKSLSLGLGTASSSSSADRNYSTLVKIAFQSLTLVCDAVSMLSPTDLRLCISTLGQFGRQADTNIALNAAESLLWSISDSIQAKRKDADQEEEFSELWMFLLLELLGLCTDPRSQVREGAIQTLFRTLQLYGATLSLETWDKCVWKVIFPLLDALTNEIGMQDSSSANSTTADAWNDTKTLTLNSTSSIWHSFLSLKIVRLDTFLDAWDVFVSHIQTTVLQDSRSNTASALRCLEKGVRSMDASVPELKEKLQHARERTWRAWEHIGLAVVRKTTLPESEGGQPVDPFTQESLVAFVDLVRATRQLSRQLDDSEWSLDRLTQLVTILKGVLTYPNSPDYRPDVDGLSPVQNVVLEVMTDVQLSPSGSASLVIKDLAECASLPFLAAFDAPRDSRFQTPQRRITYIAVAKKIMPMLVQLYLRFKDSAEIYADGTVESILSAYSIPVKLKYDCPAPSKAAKKEDPPLWKTATSNFLSVVKEAVVYLNRNSEDLDEQRIEGIWRAILDVYRGGILADCTPVTQLTLEQRQEEENFDLTLISSLEIDVSPRLGHRRIPDHLVGQLGTILQHGSRIYEADAGWTTPASTSPTTAEFQKVTATGQDLGRTESGALTVRERFSYWCLELLFLICSNVTEENAKERRRLAAINLPCLLSRCKATMVNYVADEALRGNLPFPRARDEELLFVLRELLKLRLHNGSLKAALSQNPTQMSSELPPLDPSQSPSKLVADAVSRSEIGHLFHLYPVFLEIASIPRKAPSAWFKESSGGEEATSHHDARDLARECLRLVGKEMGVDG